MTFYDRYPPFSQEHKPTIKINNQHCNAPLPWKQLQVSHVIFPEMRLEKQVVLPMRPQHTQEKMIVSGGYVRRWITVIQFGLHIWDSGVFSLLPIT